MNIRRIAGNIAAALAGAALMVASVVVAQQSTVGGVPISSGTFLVTLNSSCATPPTATARWVKVGKTVTIHFSSGFTTCTSNNTNRISDSSIPAQLRPLSNPTIGIVGASDNGNRVSALVGVTNGGAFRFTNHTGAGATASGGGGWTASGNTDIGSFSVTYQIAN